MRLRRRIAFGLAVLWLGGLASVITPSWAQSGLRAVTYRGYTVRIPPAWPVYRLTRASHTCVRFDRHALYLGTPSAQQVCPATAAGRQEAILLEPIDRAAHAAEMARSPVPDLTTFHPRGTRVLVTAAWWRRPAVIERALGLGRLPRQRLSVRHARLRRAPRARARAAAAVYTGQGFDACSAPSSAAMAAWGSSSPYHAVGIYVGGINAACPPGRANPNLTPDWVSQQVAAGWGMIPIYVGLQAPSNSCGCAGISPSQASAQGTSAADDAIADAQSLGLPAGNPIYFDMEAYSRTQANTSSVLAFLAAWTAELHAQGYVSGVYSSVGSGVSDLAAQWGTSYTEPDDIWFADWNGQATTTTSYLSASEWSNHQRLHQYRGGHDETHGGHTINIDSDYLDGATGDTVAAPSQVPAPALVVSPGVDGSIALRMSWPGGSGLASWEVLGGADPNSLAAVGRVAASGASTLASVHSTEPYFAVQALGSGGQVLAASSPVTTPAHLAIFGRSAFVSAGGTGGVPVGCYTGVACHVATTISAGRHTLVRTGSESVGAGGTGFLYFTLSRADRSRLVRAGTLPVTVTIRDRSGASAALPLQLVSFSTTGRAPKRWSWPAHGIRILGMTSFVSPRGIGGVLAACIQTTPCRAATTLSLGKTVLAQTGGEWIGANEVGYLTFTLNSSGSALLSRTAGNQLGVRATLSGTGIGAVAGIVLTRF